MLFTGHYEHTIDAKHRLAIPADIRGRWDTTTHGGAWYAVPYVGQVIRLYTETGFTTRARDYSSSLTPDEDEAELLTTLFGLSARLEMDSAGRIRLPDEMLELVAMPSEVSLVGAGEWLEIRDRAAWLKSRRQRMEGLPERMRRIEQKRRAKTNGGE